MSVCYWGDQFYGIDRIKCSHLFDKEKERKLIIKELIDEFDEEDLIDAIQNYDLNFGSPNELDLDNGLYDITKFLNGTNVFTYHENACNQDIMFFGIPYQLPWEMEKIESQYEVNQRIFKAIKPILKDDVKFKDIEPLFKRYSFNGADNYVTYYEY